MTKHITQIFQGAHPSLCTFYCLHSQTWHSETSIYSWDSRTTCVSPYSAPQNLSLTTLYSCSFSLIWPPPTCNLHNEFPIIPLSASLTWSFRPRCGPGVDSASNRNEYLLTYLLTPRCKVLLEKLTGLQLVKKFPAFHGTRRFITVLTNVRHLSLYWANPIQSIYPHPTSWRSILILSTHLCLGLPSGLLPSGFPSKYQEYLLGEGVKAAGA